MLSLWGLFAVTPLLALFTGRQVLFMWAASAWVLGLAAFWRMLSRTAESVQLLDYLKGRVAICIAIAAAILLQAVAILQSGAAAAQVALFVVTGGLCVAACSPSVTAGRARLAKGMLLLGSLGVVLLLIEIGFWTVEASRPENSVRSSWGHAIHWNRYGFRERDFERPRPAGLYRVMVLGDSFTFGVGLDAEDRYTHLMENDLRKRLDNPDIEVLNFGLRGLSTMDERDLFGQLLATVQPNRIVIGFCINDPQPRRQSYAVEQERFGALWTTLDTIAALGLSRTGEFVRRRCDQLIRNAGLIPQWPAALDRAYQPDSAEWTAFCSALNDIAGVCISKGMDPPIFAALLSGSGDFSQPSEQLENYIRWTRLAAEAARQRGYEVVDTLPAFVQEGDRNRDVNPWDPHPDAQCNRVFAQCIVDTMVHSQGRLRVQSMED